MRTFLAEQRALPCSYREVGATRERMPEGYTTDCHRVRLGADFPRVREALRAWAMFPASMTRIEPAEPPVEGAVVVVILHLLGTYWLNAMRVVYVIDEPDRFAFACGTLPGHVARGEERFTVERTSRGVFYEVASFSEPQLLAARVAKPITRLLRAQFVKESLAAMRRVA